MNKKTLYMAILILAIIFSSKVYGAPAMEAEADFAYVEGNEWILLELHSEEKIVPMDRQKLAAMNMPDVFTIRFQDGLLGGMGAPNRYTAPYSTGKNRTINIGLIASTMMFSFIEPDGLNEKKYFNYLSGALRWDIREGKLELYSMDSDGEEAVLVFGR